MHSSANFTPDIAILVPSLVLQHHNDINNYLCPYDLNGPMRNVFDAGKTLRGPYSGVGPENREFLGP